MPYPFMSFSQLLNQCFSLLSTTFHYKDLFISWVTLIQDFGEHFMKPSYPFIKTKLPPRRFHSRSSPCASFRITKVVFDALSDVFKAIQSYASDDKLMCWAEFQVCLHF
eukprot:TRINITY_DN6437_c0_g1_i1.p1 TRINITY_DN6437_c0_g1~~TRINITY_DN6437_c0_g1_i1.p1  ORF type:complete len:124 (+),score=19.69 TRINITY_DN6437_c0_g1_i1:47-373(+)